jgi:hypothetical protein
MRMSWGGALVLVGLCGCASSTNFGDDGGAEDAGPSLATVAADFAGTDCAKKFGCMAYATETRAFGDDAADCTTQETGYQTRSLSAPGASSDYTGILACVAQMKAATCQQYLDSTFGHDPTAMPACTKLTPGSVADGAGCAYSRQCKSTVCGSPEGQCGKCTALVETEGAACNPSTEVCDLSKGLLCSLTTMTCITPEGRGVSCATGDDCYYNLVCKPATMTCDDYPDSVGAPCDPAGNACSFRIGAGLTCNQQSDTCQLPAQNGLGGAACGYKQANGGMLLCGVGYLCDGSIDGFSGKCIQGHAAPPGGKCAFTGLPPNGSACEAEGLCIGGICKIDDPTTCH